MPTAGFKPAIPADERPKTLALDRSTNGIGNKSIYYRKNIKINTETFFTDLPQNACNTGLLTTPVTTE
jgi:hypothetical protein